MAKMFAQSLLLVVVVSCAALCNAAQLQEQSEEEVKVAAFFEDGLEGLSQMALHLTLVGTPNSERALERSTEPVKAIKAVVDEEALEFMRRVQNNERVKAALAKIRQTSPVDQGMDALKKLADGFNANLDKMGKDFNKQLKPMQDQAKPFLDSLEKKRQEIVKAHMDKLAELQFLTSPFRKQF